MKTFETLKWEKLTAYEHQLQLLNNTIETPNSSKTNQQIGMPAGKSRATHSLMAKLVKTTHVDKSPIRPIQIQTR